MENLRKMHVKMWDAIVNYIPESEEQSVCDIKTKIIPTLEVAPSMNHDRCFACELVNSDCELCPIHGNCGQCASFLSAYTLCNSALRLGWKDIAIEFAKSIRDGMGEPVTYSLKQSIFAVFCGSSAMNFLESISKKRFVLKSEGRLSPEFDDWYFQALKTSKFGLLIWNADHNHHERYMEILKEILDEKFF